MPSLEDHSVGSTSPSRSSAALTRLTMIHAIGPTKKAMTIMTIHNSFGMRAGIDSSGVRAQSSRA